MLVTADFKISLFFEDEASQEVKELYLDSVKDIMVSKVSERIKEHLREMPIDEFQDNTRSLRVLVLSNPTLTKLVLTIREKLSGSDWEEVKDILMNKI